MASSGALIRIIAEVTGVPAATTETYFRSLRKPLDGSAPMVNTGGRGINAARMSACDAAMLLTAILGSRFEREAAYKIVKDFERVRASANTSWKYESYEPGRSHADPVTRDGRWFFDGFSLPPLQKLTPGHSFPAALAAIIDASGTGEFDAAAGGKTLLRSFEVSVFGPNPGAAIEIQFTTDSKFLWKEQLVYSLDDEYNMGPEDHAAFLTSVRPQFPMGDLEIRRTITDSTIQAVADLLQDESPDLDLNPTEAAVDGPNRGKGDIDVSS